jgi:ABC-type nickel/cobalt efflux system permease component RcnA
MVLGGMSFEIPSVCHVVTKDKWAASNISEYMVSGGSAPGFLCLGNQVYNQEWPNDNNCSSVGASQDSSAVQFRATQRSHRGCETRLETGVWISRLDSIPDTHAHAHAHAYAHKHAHKHAHKQTNKQTNKHTHTHKYLRAQRTGFVSTRL